KWDRRFLEIAQKVADWSKDPSTKVGTIIIDRNNRLVSTGYNGFPQGVLDLPERYNDRNAKYSMIIHSELNAIIFAKRDLRGYTLYSYPLQPCDRCAGPIIQTGIKRCVAPPCPPDKDTRWQKSFQVAQTMFKEAGVRLDLIELSPKYLGGISA
ncbi:MAG: hypothetical protein A3B17_02600, partial [Candidatus Yanofskybacteria bacterium RIFCSPLOWO2_01_FULL_45_72]